MDLEQQGLWLMKLLKESKVSKTVEYLNRKSILTWWGLGEAVCKWIASEMIRTSTNWIMIIDVTNCVESAGAGARISTFFSDASFVARTF